MYHGTPQWQQTASIKPRNRSCTVIAPSSEICRGYVAYPKHNERGAEQAAFVRGDATDCGQRKTL